MKAWRIAFEDAILAVLRDNGPMDTSQIRDHFERRHYQDVYTSLIRLAKRKRVLRSGDHRLIVWTLDEVALKVPELEEALELDCPDRPDEVDL